MDHKMKRDVAEKKRAMAEYGRTIKEHGSRAGEPVIEKWEKKIPDFRRWAYALGIMLRSDELLEERVSKSR